MIVIGLTGPAGAGKDTAAGYLADHLTAQGLSVRVQAWANLLKVAAAAALGFEGTPVECVDFCDRLKVHGHVGYSLRPAGQAPEAHTITGREFLEKFGTEGGRDVYGENHWVDLALPSPTHVGYEGREAEGPLAGPFAGVDVLIDTTTRFPNEVARIREWRGKIIRIEREGWRLRARTEGHPSRYGIPAEDCDAVILNAGTLEDLETNIINAYEMLAAHPHQEEQTT